MREIKFRCWDKEFTKMRVIGFSVNKGILSNDETCIIMQYTGLKDKNGLTEIYEGDIIGLDGLKKGHQYENSDLLKDQSNLLIQGFGTASWETTNKKAMERGCEYSE